MKPLFLVLAFLGLASTAVADLKASEVRHYKIEKFEFSASHAKNPVSGSLTVNTASQTVKMEIQQGMPVCPAGMACIQVMPMPIEVELPIHKIEKDSCGITRILAYVDNRPADGLLEEITIEDASELTCQTLVPVYSNATYRTAHFSMIDGKAYENKSKMIIERQKAASKVETFNFEEGKFLQGFPGLEVPSHGTLKISQKHVEMEVFISLNCGNGPCPMYAPHPIRVKLPILKKTPSFCGDKILASKTEKTHFGRSIVQVEVVDYRNAACEIYLKHLIHVNFQVKDIMSGGAIQKSGVLYFN